MSQSIGVEHGPGRSDAAAFARPPTLLGWLAWGLLVAVVVGAADALLSVVGTLLLGTTWRTFVEGPMALSLDLAWRLFAGIGSLRIAGTLAMLVVVAIGHRVLPAGGAGRWLGLAGLVAVATGAGWWVFQGHYCEVAAALGYEARFAKYCRPEGMPAVWIPVLAARQLQYALLIVALYEFAMRSRRAAEALHEAGLRRARLAGELAGSRAQLLQAQVEPHFLFNSLANVRRLIRTDSAAATAMLADLLRYLQEALPRLRESDSTLGREIELVRAYLDVHAVRMGARLRYEIALPDALAGTPIPPMLLLTLVENALKHGLQPLPEGGAIAVAASQAAGVLTLTVGDTGRGMGEGSGHGTGLANVRARLRALYGAAASLSLHVNEPRGVLATITLPRGAS